MGQGKYTIPLNATAMSLLHRIREKMLASIDGGDRYVFSKVPYSGIKLTKRELQRAFQTAATRAKMTEKFRYHDMRHTHATRLVQLRVDLYTVSKLMGHASLKETERYAHHSVESLRHGVEIVDMRDAVNALIGSDSLRYGVEMLDAKNAVNASKMPDFQTAIGTNREHREIGKASML
jgi:hypothetical protein